MTTSPMFPLGSVLLPGMLLPLHVFEDRYRRLVDDVLAADEPEFGVAPIERGSEVGGGDLRAMSACTARVLEAARTEDGRWALVALGTRRVRVVSWLDDDPYPRAVVEDWPDDDDAPADAPARLAALVGRVRRLGALARQLGAAVPPGEPAFSDDPGAATFELAVMSPLGAFDRRRVLEGAGPGARLDLLEDLLAEQEQLLEARLALGGEGPPGSGAGPVPPPA